jgi:CBS domain-containing protein
MTSPAITVAATTRYPDVVDRFLQCDVRAAPVVDARGLLVGIVTEGDLVRRGGQGRALGLLADALRGDGTAWVKKAATTTARAFMTRQPRFATAEDDLASVAVCLIEHQHHLLPVVDANNAVVGVVTGHDLIRRFEADDAYVAAEIVELLDTARSSPSGLQVTVSVTGGIVSVRGTTERTEDIPLVRRVIARVPGVLAIRSDLEVREHPGATRSELPALRSRQAGAGTR